MTYTLINVALYNTCSGSICYFTN